MEAIAGLPAGAVMWASQRSAYGHQSMDSQRAAAARALAGNPDNEEPA